MKKPDAYNFSFLTHPNLPLLTATYSFSFRRQRKIGKKLD